MATTLPPSTSLSRAFRPLSLDSGEDLYLLDPLTLEEMVAMTGPGTRWNHLEPSESMLGVDLSYNQSHAATAHPSSPSSQQLSSVSASEAASRSPGGPHAPTHPLFPSLHDSTSGAFDSSSPGNTTHILTPSSTNQDYPASFHGDVDEFDHAANPISPSTDSNVSPSSDGNLVDLSSPGSRRGFRMHGGMSPPTTLMTTRPSAATASGVSALPSRSFSVARTPTTATVTHYSTAPWESFATSTAQQVWMDHHNSTTSTDPFGTAYAYNDDPSFANTGQQFEDVLPDATPIGWDNFTVNSGFVPSTTTLSVRAIHNDQPAFPRDGWAIPSSLVPPPEILSHTNFNQYVPATLSQRQLDQLALQQMQHRMPPATTGPFDPSTTSIMTRMQQGDALQTTPAELDHRRFSTVSTGNENNMDNATRVPVRRSGHTYAFPDHQHHTSTSQHQERRTQPVLGSSHLDVITAGPADKNAQPLARRPTAVLSSNAPRRNPLAERTRRGGRQKHSHLKLDAREKSNKMRKLAACWRCALQRDPCDDGSPCKRCLVRSQKGQTYFFDCDRSKLPDFVHDFLPPSMTMVSQKQSIEDSVMQQVRSWDRDNPLDIWLTSGYGPALQWRLYEFEPSTDEFLGQLQYLQDPRTQLECRRVKYSPPFGLLKLDASDDTRLENYLDELMQPAYLLDFGWTCFEEESQTDPDSFQAGTVFLICTLYEKTKDKALRAVLHDVIRMLIINYIMGHTLTILEDTLPTVLKSIRRSEHPTIAVPHTSPRLANRQLKFFFSLFRSNIYTRILKWQQQTFHTSGKKEATWLQAFVALLGFAMVLEDVQRILQIQADAKAFKEEMDSHSAQAEAYNACQRIDARFGLLVGLFQCKYRDKTWGANGSFGNGTPEEKEPAAREFLANLRASVEKKKEHLRSRGDARSVPNSECLYTSRLVARFLLPFLALPP